MMSVDTQNYRQLVEHVELVTSGSVAIDAASFQATLQKSQSNFLNLLRYKGPDAQARHEVVSRNPATPNGHVRLDEEDVKEVLLLSDELHLDEILSLQCILDAHEQSGEVTAEAAAGVFFEERRGLLGSLHRLLQVQALALAEVPDDIYEVVCAFNNTLLSRQAQGGSVLVGRLIQLVQDTSLEARQDSKLPRVVDLQGQVTERHLLLQWERTLLCECLAFACRIQPRQPPKDIANLVQLQHQLSMRTRGHGAGDVTAVHQANIVLAAVAQTLLPRVLEEDQEDTADVEAIEKLSKDADLAAKIENDAAPEDGFMATVRLAWGVLLANQGAANYRERATRAVKQATEAGVFRFLHRGVLTSAPFEDDAQEHKELYVQIFNQLTMEFLDSEPGRSETEALCTASIEAAAAGEHGQAGEAARRDSIDALLNVLEDIYSVFPSLWLEKSLRYDMLGVIMNHVAGHQVLREAPDVLVAYLGVLHSLAVTEYGARSMFNQLQASNTYPALSWTKMLDVMKQYCARYTAHTERQALGAEGSSGQRSSELLVPESDTRGLAAYLRLFTRVFGQAALADVEAWTADLEEQAGLRPLWELFFQLMCHPVPQELKAALDEAIAAFARRPDLVGPLWDRLLRSVVVQPQGAQELGGALALPRADLGYQLTEIEARAEDYSETLAFARLLNALMRAARGAFPEAGRPYAHFAEFVRVNLLGQLSQRGYRDERQKWDLAAVCMEHLQLWLQTLDPAMVSLPDSHRLPGLSILFDLLGERQAMKTLLHLLLTGTDTLAAERKDSLAGAAKEGAMLAALKLLRTALQVDREMVLALRTSQQHVHYETLEAVLKRDLRRIPLLLDYVRYPYNPLLQAEAVRIAHFLTDRIPNLVDLLLPPLARGLEGSYVRIRAGYAACLHESLASTGASVMSPEDTSGDVGPIGDERGDLVLQLLLHTLDQPAPNFAHLLLGYNVEDGVQGVAQSYLEPQRTFSCLRVLLKAAQSESLPAAKPELFESTLEVLYSLAAAPESGFAMQHLLRQVETLSFQLDAVACTPLPDQANPRASSLYQRAWLLSLAALELHHADAAVPAHRESLNLLLRALFMPAEGFSGSGEEGRQRLSRRAEILELVAYPLTEPLLAMETRPEARRLQQKMDLDSLLTSTSMVEEGGIRTKSQRGQLCYSLASLSQALQERYEQAELDSRRYGASAAGGPNPELREACRAAMQYAQKYNAYVEELGGQAAVIAAWQSVIEVAVTRRYDLLGALAAQMHAEGLAERSSAAEMVQDLLQDTLEVLLRLMPTPGAVLAPALCQVVHTLLARLQEQAASQLGVETTPTSGVRLLAQCHQILQQLLALLRAGYSRREIRLPLYGALLSYLHWCKGPRLARLPPSVLKAVLAGVRAPSEVGQAAAEIDEANSELEDGNSALLSEDLFLVEMLARDAVGQAHNQLTRTLSLTLLTALVAADTGTIVLQSVYSSGLPGRLLQDLIDTPHRALLQVSSKAHAAMHVAEAQGALLLELARGGLAAKNDSSRQRLSLLTAISQLRTCQVLDLQPEEPGMESSSEAETLRARLGHIIPPLLRLVAAILAGLPSSRQAREAAAAFVDSHHRALLRILREAASPAVRSWAPGQGELEQATLVVQLLSRLVGMEAHMPQAAAQAKASVFLLASRFGALDSKSMIPAVQELYQEREGGMQVDGKEPNIPLACAVQGLRGALAQWLREACMQQNGAVMLRIAAAQPGSTSGTVPTLLLIRDMLHQATEDMYGALDERSRILDALQSVSVVQAAPIGQANGRSLMTKSVPKAPLARAAANTERQVTALLYLAENSLAIIFCHLWRHSTDIGSVQDLEQLKRALTPTLDSLERVSDGVLSQVGDASSLQLLVRRTNDRLSAY